MNDIAIPPYSLNFQWDPIDRIFVVTVPELPGCRTHGKTYEEALQAAKDVIELWLSDLRPSDYPAIEPFDLDAPKPPAWQRARARAELRKAS